MREDDKPNQPGLCVARFVVHDVLEELQSRVASVAQLAHLRQQSHRLRTTRGVLHRLLHRRRALRDVVQELHERERRRLRRRTSPAPAAAVRRRRGSRRSSARWSIWDESPLSFPHLNGLVDVSVIGLAARPLLASGEEETATMRTEGREPA